MRKLPPVNAVRAFEVAARHMQFQSAAKELGVTPSALSYQIRQLETHLGKPLFKRLNRAVELTSAGELLSGRVCDAFERLEEAFALLAPAEDDNKLVVSSGPATSSKWLAPRLHGFIEDNPDIDLRLSASLHLVDFVADGIDASIRFGLGNYSGLYVEPMFSEVVMPLVSPNYFEKMGGDANEALLEKSNLIYDDTMYEFWGVQAWTQWTNRVGYHNVTIGKGTRFSHADHAIDAAVDGAGIVMGRLSFAYRDLAAGRLIAPYSHVLPLKEGFHFCCPNSGMEKPKVLNFIAWLRDEIADQEELMKAFLKTKIILDN